MSHAFSECWSPPPCFEYKPMKREFLTTDEPQCFPDRSTSLIPNPASRWEQYWAGMMKLVYSRGPVEKRIFSDWPFHWNSHDKMESRSVFALFQTVVSFLHPQPRSKSHLLSHPLIEKEQKPNYIHDAFLRSQPRLQRSQRAMSLQFYCFFLLTFEHCSSQTRESAEFRSP